MNVKAYQQGGSCCNNYVIKEGKKNIFIKEIDKNVQGIENGYKKFFYEIEHMNKYQYTGLFPKIYFIKDDLEKYTVGMEYCFQGMTLADLIRNSNINMNLFEKGFSYIMDNLFSKMYSSTLDIKPLENYIDECYYKRIQRRLEQAMQDEFLNKYGLSRKIVFAIQEGCYINNEFYPSIFKYLDFLINERKLNEMLKLKKVCQSHYDLCPQNVLVNYQEGCETIKEYKLIDVRGEGETGLEKRHYMYDMGKMLLGLDCFDLFRIFNGKVEMKGYDVQIDGEKIPRIKFKLKRGIAERYEKASSIFWNHMEKREYYCDLLKEDLRIIKLRMKFSQCMMYHPDIPCRIIYEQDEEMAMLFYIRGMQVIRAFFEEVWGYDPVGKFSKKVKLWDWKL